MPNVIKSLLVGIGFDLDKKSMDGVNSGLDAITSKATKLGAVVAGAFGLKALTSDFAAEKDKLGKFAEIMGLAAHQVNALGNALIAENGSLDAFMSQLKGLASLRQELKMSGSAGFVEDLGMAGAGDIADAIVNAKDELEAYLAIAEKMQNLDLGQRQKVGRTLGLDDAAIRLLSKGRPYVESQMGEYGRMRPVTKEMTDIAAEFNTELHRLTQNIGGFADIIGTSLTDTVARAMKKINKSIDENRPEIRDFFNKEANSIRFFYDLLSGNDVGHYSISGMRIDQMDDWLANSARLPGFEFPDFEGFYQRAKGYIPDSSTSQVGRTYRGKVDRSPVTIPVRVELDGPSIKRQTIEATYEINQQTINDFKTGEDG